MTISRSARGVFECCLSGAAGVSSCNRIPLHIHPLARDKTNRNETNGAVSFLLWVFGFFSILFFARDRRTGEKVSIAICTLYKLFATPHLIAKFIEYLPAHWI